MTDPHHTTRKAVLTDEDHRAIADLLKCHHSCQFSGEEVQFVRDWLDTAKTARSEIVKWVVRSIIWAVGIIAGVQVAIKYGWLKIGGK